MKKVFYFLGFIALFASCTSNDFQKELEAEATVFSDESNSVQIPAILIEENQQKFQSVSTLNLGLIKCNQWIKIPLENEKIQQAQYLEVSRSKVLRLQVHVIDSALNHTQLPLLDGMNRNVVSLQDVDRKSSFILILADYLHIPTSIYIQPYADIHELHNSLNKSWAIYVVYVFLLVVSIAFSLFYFFKSTKRNWLFAIYPITLFLYLFFYNYDSGMGKLFLPNWLVLDMAILANAYYLFALIPILFIHGFPEISIKIKKIYPFYVSGIAVSFLILYTFWFHLFTPILVGLTLISSWIIIILLVRHHKLWLKDLNRAVFVLAISWYFTMPTFKAAQNLGFIEGSLAENSFSTFYFLEIATWGLFIFLTVRTENREKLQLQFEQAKLNEKINDQLLDGKEKEQKRIVKELEESVIPLLLKSLEQSDVNQIRSKNEIDKVIQELRYLSRVYIAPKIIENGLEKEIQRFLGLIQSIHHFEGYLDFKLQNENELSEYMKIILYRTIQEAVGNSILHGKANKITIQVISNDDNILINIEDNGQFSDQDLKEGVGLKGIRSRLSDYVHDLKLANDNTGCRLELTIKQD